MSADERREAIIAAVIPVFAAKGFRGTTTKDLAEASGVSEALIYRHFPSKESIYESIQSRCCRQLTERAGELMIKMEPSTSSLVFGVYLMVAGPLMGSPGDVVNHNIIRQLFLRSILEDGELARSFLASRLGRTKKLQK